MNIGIIGSGGVGGTLGARWAAAGHAVVFGSRDPQSPSMRALVERSGPSSRAASSEEAANAAEIVVVATPWPATRAVVEALPLVGKIVVDATNPLLPRLAGLEVGTSSSGAELVAQWAAGARVVKAFNTIGIDVMANPGFGADAALLLYCGDDAPAKLLVHQLALDLGFDPLDAGPLTQARLLEPLALLWISLFLTRGSDFAFQMITRKP